MSLGYQDTPLIPGTRWHVHDGERPQPRVVTPGSLSSLPPVTPPSDAFVLFDGTSGSARYWRQVKDQSPLQWKIENGCLEVVKRTGNIETIDHFGDIQLHLEWAAPQFIEGDGQGRGNSGVFLMGRYEVQILDNWQNPTYPDGTAGGLYGLMPPLVNACCRRGDWNIYDIIWEAPVFDGDTVVKRPKLTVLVNGVLVHHALELAGRTAHKQAMPLEPHQPTGPIVLQDHGNPVRFRNIWVRKLTGYDSGVLA